LDPRRGKPGKSQQLRVSDLQGRNPNAPTRGRHRHGDEKAGPSRSEPRANQPEPQREYRYPDPRGNSRYQDPRGADLFDPPTVVSSRAALGAAEGARTSSRPVAGKPISNLRRGSLIGGRIVIAMLSIAALIGSGIAWATYRQFTQGIQHGSALPSLPKGKKDIDGKAQNILLLGNDSTAGATDAEVRALGTTPDRTDSLTDTMMILHVPADGKKASIVSFPRDSYVSIPGHGQDKINAAYIDGFNDAQSQGVKDLLSKQNAGIQLAAKTLSNLTGLQIDHYVQVNLLGFYEISEAIGGVNLCLNEAQNKYTEGDPSHPNGYSGINLKKGWNYNVKGTQALAFVRQRHGFPDGLGDIDRIKRQQYFLSAVFHKVTSSSTLLNPFKLQKVLNAVRKSLITDPRLDILQFVQQFSKIASGQITFGTPPWKFGTSPDGSDVVLVDPAAVKAYVDKMVGAPVDKKLQTVRPVLPTQVSVTVLNQSNTNLAATNNAKTLGNAGFLATVGDTDQHTDQTLIEYADGQQAQAKTLSQYVPGAVLQQTSGVTKVTLILGTDGIQAKATPPKPTATKKTTTPTKPKSSPQPSGTTNAAQNSTSCID
jgi:LCP family protein required for cell wall assembly